MDEVHHGMQLVGLDAKTSTLECNMSRDMHAERVWAARYNTWLLIKLSPKGVVFSFLFFSFLFFSFLFFSFHAERVSCISDSVLPAGLAPCTDRHASPTRLMGQQQPQSL